MNDTNRCSAMVAKMDCLKGNRRIDLSRSRIANAGEEYLRRFTRDKQFPEMKMLASKDNTNFLFRVEGEIDDALAAEFNGMFYGRGTRQVVATARRMRLLKERKCVLVFERAVVASAHRNLTMIGGSELESIVAEMLRHYYYDGEGAADYCSLADLVLWVAERNVCGVEDFGKKRKSKKRECTIKDYYWYKVSRLLFDMFTGMRLGSAWCGHSSVNGGYIVVQGDGEVLAYHTCIADEFKDFLVRRLALEQPSHKRHLSMAIEKTDGKFYIKLPLQIRFRAMKNDGDCDEEVLHSED